MSVHVCAPATVTFRRRRYCPTCQTSRRMVGSAAVWYGTTWTCCTCGDAWGDGERLPRPFARGWREREAARARRRWDSAPFAAEARRLWGEMLREEIGP